MAHDRLPPEPKNPDAGRTPAPLGPERLGVADAPLSTDELADRIAEIALLRGEFTLRSGRTSRYYLDKYRFTTRPELLAPLGRAFAERIRALGGDTSPPDRLAGAELGGIPLVTAAALATGLPAVFVRNQKKDYGTAKQLEGVLEPGDRVVLLEDVATSGGQAIEACKSLEGEGAIIVAVICTVDRQEGAREAVEAAGYRFESLLTKSDLGIDE
ncbi:MAG: orotate phosphoribosyltransferase [Phycisphaerales bacterium]|nr:MAG: orotate phosphoribosyltransferase [Phycisphaerales bacterium]